MKNTNSQQTRKTHKLTKACQSPISIHGALVANEAIYEARRLKKKCLIFKVDYGKAYDSVSWDFLIYMLKRLGFNGRRIKWIKRCLESCRVSILVNGSPSKEFPVSKGLR